MAGEGPQALRGRRGEEPGSEEAPTLSRREALSRGAARRPQAAPSRRGGRAVVPDLSPVDVMCGSWARGVGRTGVHRGDLRTEDHWANRSAVPQSPRAGLATK